MISADVGAVILIGVTFSISKFAAVNAGVLIWPISCCGLIPRGYNWRTVLGVVFFLHVVSVAILSTGSTQPGFILPILLFIVAAFFSLTSVILFAAALIHVKIRQWLNRRKSKANERDGTGANE